MENIVDDSKAAIGRPKKPLARTPPEEIIRRLCITKEEFGKEFDLSMSTTNRLIKEGALRVKKIGRLVRIERDEVDRWWDNLPEVVKDSDYIDYPSRH